ncbi:MAG: pyrroloquinoline quinone biosynthesis protein PqqB [SAR86 cluster bacterium]|uniref:Pyrroloquinoline quinone biosynthesis protein PqqB n=1 Tax=SAR86 cluster bacterium TaxID=2030880 RepID=A0A2A5AUZ6_9GAMM|nr:MAG: pyrroloquinoline quinone biosynthesis protein PqqB [SAR86 cluster bacterium]
MNSFMKLSCALFIAFTTLIASSVTLAQNSEPYIYILGVVQDAGYPQTGCYQPHCLLGWQDKQLQRGATSLAVIDPASNQKFLFEATPNLPAQLYDLEVEATGDRYQLAGIFLTHAHIGHYTGLMFLGHEAMSVSNMPVYAMPRMADYLRNNGPWSQLVSYENIQLIELENEKPQQLAQLKITPFLVPHRDEFSETVGYRIEGPNKTAIFIPDINKWSLWNQDIADLVQSVDYALVDATFYNDQELPGRDMSKIPHPFVSESIEIFSSLSVVDKNKVWFIHMNHTNPLLNPDSKESKLVQQQGFNIAVEGQRLPL